LVEKPSTLLPEVKTIIKEAQYKGIRQAVATANKFENVKW
jgi:hydroxymethylpyrimidine pyrophosphatase-like HAD family hydrolase